MSVICAAVLPLSAAQQSVLADCIDYSYCGYHASADTIPLVKARAYVEWADGDMSATIQQAIDYVSALPVGADGFRGAVQLAPGTYQLRDRLVIGASGVVLRGAGRNATVLHKEGVDRGSLLRIEGRDGSVRHDTLWLSGTIAKGTCELSVAADALPVAGQTVEIVRQSSMPWIESVGCRIYGGGIDALAWKPGDIDIHWLRTVVKSDGGRLQLDAPLTMGFDASAEASYTDNKGKVHEHVAFSPAYLCVIEDDGEIKESGIEQMTLESGYSDTNANDENHCWTGISVEHACDCWVRLVDFRHLAGSGVIMQSTARRVTVEDCRYLEPVSENAGLRRTSFYVLGQQCLVQRCLARHGRHDFVTGYCAAGPNAFVQCEAIEALSYSGGLDSWACGTLYDIVDIDGHDLVMKNLGQDNNGAGWNTASGMMWNCTAAEIHCYSPDTININHAYGAWAQFSGNGDWQSSNNHMQPRTLYYTQLARRLGLSDDAWKAGQPLATQARILDRSTDATTSPTVLKAQQMARVAREEPRLTLDAWICDAPALSGTAKPAATSSRSKTACRVFSKAATPDTHAQLAAAPIEIVNGYITQSGSILTGGRYQTPWWNGKLRPTTIANPVMTKPALTRFVPDREGLGFTDRIDSVVAWMQQNDILAWDQNYGLWYDRRRDDHERIRRRDAATWAPYWEQPWANTGQGHGWNGLSLYDLTQNNTWYYDRLHQFAAKTAPMGKLLYLEHYFQHNILEAGAHWVDSPWRPVNNVNQTVFPEPVPFTGDKRVFVAEWFYDEQNVTMRDLHRQYIRRNLEAFSDLPNVVHYISEEYTGPLHFTRFWVETIRDWEQETGRHALVALAATKDVQDSILSDAALSDVIDIIDIRYWHYKSKPDPGNRKTWDDGKDIYDPQGGVNLAPRQHARQQPVGKVTFSDAYRSVSEYHLRYPGKAVVYYAQNYPDMAWAVLMAGGSAAGVTLADDALREQLTAMHIAGPADRTDAKVLQSTQSALVYGLAEATVTLSGLQQGRYQLSEIDRETGACVGKPQNINLKQDEFSLEVKPDAVYWLRRK